jgi:hypothetical protein
VIGVNIRQVEAMSGSADGVEVSTDDWRVKGKGKFGNNPTGATSIQALKALALPEDNRIKSLLRWQFRFLQLNTTFGCISPRCAT